MNFGEKVRHLRRLKELTQTELADRADISPAYMNQIEKGKDVDSIGEKIIKAIANALEVSAEDLKSSGSGYKEDLDRKSSSAKSVELAFEVERQSWYTLERSLRDTIAAQQITIDVLKDLLSTYQKLNNSK